MEVFEDLVERSHELAAALVDCVSYETYDDSPRIVLSDVLTSLAFEHAHSARVLLQIGVLPSALVVHRSQFETALRSLWVLYAATDELVDKLSAELTTETELATKNIPLAAEMLKQLAVKAPANAYNPLNEFKTYSWGALNSYVHAGIHPIRRHAEGYPLGLLANVMKNINGLTVSSAMQAAILTGVPNLQREVLAVADRYPDCLTPKN